MIDFHISFFHFIFLFGLVLVLVSFTGPTFQIFIVFGNGNKITCWLVGVRC